MKNPFHKYGHRREEIKRAKKEFYLKLFLFGAIFLFFALAFGLAKIQTWGTSGGTQSPQEAALTPEQLLERESTIEEELAMVRMELKELDAPTLDPEATEALHLKAIDLQSRLNDIRRQLPGRTVDDGLLRTLRQSYHQFKGDLLFDQSILAEQKARNAYQNNQINEALLQLRKAINLQSTLNNQFSLSDKKNSARINQMESDLTNWTAKPLAEQVESLSQSAEIALDENNIEEAIIMAKKAVEIQQNLNREFRGSRYASFIKLSEAQSLLARIELSEPLSQLQQTFAEAITLYEANNIPQAREVIADTDKRLTRLINSAPSQFTAELLRLKESVEIKNDTINSHDSFQNITAQDRKLINALASMNATEAQSLLPELFREMEQTQALYPRSAFINPDRTNRIRALNQFRDRLDSIFTILNQLLIPLPDSSAKMFKTECPQRLLTLLNLPNPSSLPSPNLPVDSITIPEIDNLITLLRWILQKDVRLPRQNEISSALLPSEIDTLARQSWNSQNSNGEVQPVATSPTSHYGFHDLLGNLSEWIIQENNQYGEFGGSVRDNPIRLGQTPIENRAPNNRNRFVGFRLIVE